MWKRLRELRERESVSVHFVVLNTINETIRFSASIYRTPSIRLAQYTPNGNQTHHSSTILFAQRIKCFCSLFFFVFFLNFDFVFDFFKNVNFKWQIKNFCFGIYGTLSIQMKWSVSFAPFFGIYPATNFPGLILFYMFEMSAVMEKGM